MTAYSVVISRPTLADIAVTASGPVPGMPGFFVYIRPDEIVFRLGVVWDKSITPANLGPYTATIFADGVQVASYPIQTHYWFAQWMHYIAPDDVVRTPQQILAQGLFLPYGKIGTKLPAASTNKYTGPFSLAGIAANMSTTGERGDIGFTNEWGGNAFVRGETGPVLEAAKGAFAVSMFLTDETTNKPVNMIQWPLANTLWAKQYNWIGPLTTGVANFDTGHHPEMGALAYLLTKKLRHLETIQHAATNSFLGTPFYTNLYGGKPPKFFVGAGQTRSLAWAMRSALLAWKCTQLAEQEGPLPDYLLPSSYWDAILEQQRQWFVKYFQNDPAIQTFRMHPSEAGPAQWQQNYWLIVLALFAMWRPEWRDYYLWALKPLLMFTSGKYGWPQACPVPYRVDLGPNFKDDEGLNFLSGRGSEFFGTMKEVWDNFAQQVISGANTHNMTAAQIQALQADPANGGAFLNWDGYGPLSSRAALACAVHLDRNKIVDVSSVYPELEEAFSIQDAMAMKYLAAGNMNGAMPARISINPGASLPIPPPTNPPPTQPPGVPMPTDLTALQADVDAIVALVPQIQTAVDNLELQISALKAASSSGTVDATAIAAIVTKLDGVKAGLKAAVDDAAS